MPKKSQDIRLIVKAEVDKAIKGLNKAEQEVDDLATSGAKVNKSFGKASGVIKGFVAAFAIKEIAQEVIELGKLAAEAENVERAFRNIPESKKFLKDLRSGVKGTVSDLELMRQGLIGLDLGATNEQLKTFAEFARLESVRKGSDTLQTFDNIMGGVMRGSTELLDNFGLSLTQVNKEIEVLAVEKLDKVASKLSTVERRELAVEAATRIMSRRLAEAGEIGITKSEQINQAVAGWENLRVEMGKLVSGPLADIAGIIADDIIKPLREFINENQLISVNQQLADINGQIANYARLKAKAAQKGGDIGSVLFNEGDQQKLDNLILKAKELNNEVARLSGADFTGAGSAGLNGTGTAAAEQIEPVLGKIITAYQQKMEEFKPILSEIKHELQPIDEGTVENVQAHLDEMYNNITTKYSELADISAEILQGPFEYLAAEMLRFSRSAESVFDDFLNYLYSSMRRFIASEIVKTFALYVVGTTAFGLPILPGLLFAQSGAHIKGSKKGQLVNVGENNTEELIIPVNKFSDFLGGDYSLPGGFNINDIPAPQPFTPATSTQKHTIERSVPVAGKIIVETVAPDMARVREHYIAVNREINYPDTKYIQNNLETEDNTF